MIVGAPVTANGKIGTWLRTAGRGRLPTYLRPSEIVPLFAPSHTAKVLAPLLVQCCILFAP